MPRRGFPLSSLPLPHCAVFPLLTLQSLAKPSPGMLWNIPASLDTKGTGVQLITQHLLFPKSSGMQVSIWSFMNLLTSPSVRQLGLFRTKCEMTKAFPPGPGGIL